jgi:SAM-dependent methyltransferase
LLFPFAGRGRAPILIRCSSAEAFDRMPDPGQVRAMFARIAGRYDLLNRVLSLGIDQRWRRRVVRAAGDVRGCVVVDACCGTGDLSRAFARAGARVVGVDFTPEMLRFAAPKLADARLFRNSSSPMRTRCACRCAPLRRMCAPWPSACAISRIRKPVCARWRAW